MSLQKVDILIPTKIVEATQASSLSAKASQLMSSLAKAPQIDTGQPDLLFLRSLLVSTGSNLNDDVFLSEEMWRARNTPILKPVNWEHESGRELTEQERAENPKKVIAGSQTIGVMYNTYVIDQNGEIVPEDKANAENFEIPQNFHIVDECVIWKALYPTVTEAIAKGSQEGTLFVSMEVWFPDYCYLVGNKVVARNEETAFLDRYLRVHGGEGSYQNNKVKRVLRNITFGGKGIVRRPANEPSIIMGIGLEPMSTSANLDSAIAKNTLFDLTQLDTKGEAAMADENKDKAVALELLAKVNDENVELKAQAKEHAKDMEKMKDEKKKAEESASMMKNKADEALALFTKGAEVLGELVPGLAAKLAEAGAENFFSVVADVVRESAQAKEKAEAELAEAKELAAKAAEEARVAAREAKIDGLLEVSAAAKDGKGPDWMAEMEKKKKDKKEKMMAAVKDLGDEQFEALYEVWAEEKAAAAEVAVAAQTQAPVEIAPTATVASEQTPQSAAASSPVASDLIEQFRAELAKNGVIFDSAEALFNTVSSSKRPSDEELIDSVLSNVTASENTPPAGEEPTVGQDLTKSMGSLVQRMVNRK